jgi:hypothetical protein
MTVQTAEYRLPPALPTAMSAGGLPPLAGTNVIPSPSAMSKPVGIELCPED